jgi:cytochrome c oxidase subunit I
MFRGSVRLDFPMLFALGFLVCFLFGGFTGVMLAMPPLDFQLHDTYFVVAHFHYVLFGGSLFAVFGAIHHWFPNFTVNKLGERLGKITFVIMFIGFNLTFFPQHDLGTESSYLFVSTADAGRWPRRRRQEHSRRRAWPQGCTAQTGHRYSNKTAVERSQ